MTLSFATCSYSQLWKQFADSAKYFQDQRKADESIAYYNKALIELRKDSAGTGSYLRSSANLASLYTSKGQYGKALPLLIEAKEATGKTAGKEHPDYAKACNSLANFYMNVGQYDKAEPLFLEAKGIREKVLGKQSQDYASTCSNLATLYHYRGEYEKAENLMTEAKTIREKILGKEHPEYGSSCNSLAVLYDDMGLYEKAEALFMEAIVISRKVFGPEHPSYATTCNNFANLYLDKGEYDKAEPLYIEAKAVREKVFGKEHLAYASSCNNLALLYNYTGQYKKAEPLYTEAKGIREKVLGKGHPDYASSCMNLALLYQSTGKYDKAEGLYLEALKIRKAALGMGHPDYAKSCLNLANLYLVTEQYLKARPLYVEARQIEEKKVGKEHPDYALACDNLALLYYHTGQYENAKSLYLEAKKIWESISGRHHPSYGNSCKNLALLYQAMHRPLQAQKEFEEAYSVNAYNLSSFFQFSNEEEQAAYIENISGEDDEAFSFYVAGKIKSAQPYAISLFHRNLILSYSQALKKQLFSSGDTVVVNTYNRWVNLKKELADLYAEPLDEKKESLAAVEADAGELEKKLTRLSAAFANQQHQPDWRDLQSKLQPDEAAVEFASFHLYKGKRSTDTMLYVALVLRKDSSLPTTVSLFTEKQLQSILSSAGTYTIKGSIRELYSLNDSVLNGSNRKKKSMYNLIWKPIEKELRNIKTVYFAPAGLLYKIAFAALPINKNEVLSDRYKIVQLATTASVADQQRFYITDSDKMQLYGGISYQVDTTTLKTAALTYHHDLVASRSLPDDVTRSTGWNELPGTKQEIESIVSLSGNHYSNITSLSGTNATEESLKALAGTASPAVLHIATHGFFFPDIKRADSSQRSVESGIPFKSTYNPLMRSGLIFAGANHAWKAKPIEGIDDGILTAYEVSNLYLPNTKLVVLSACETGLGEIKGNEGVYGLQRAFKMAGAQNLVMSLWKVSDTETAEFMEEFYKNMFAQQTISDAFYNAQTVMKNKYRLQPYKWAAWVLVQ